MISIKIRTQLCLIILMIIFLFSIGCGANYYTAANKSKDTHKYLKILAPNWIASVDGIIVVDCIAFIVCIFGIINLSKSFTNIVNDIFMIAFLLLLVCYLILNLIMFFDPEENYASNFNRNYENRRFFKGDLLYYIISFKVFYVYQIIAFIVSAICGVIALYSNAQIKKKGPHGLLE